jgi:hypothetical protein
MNEEKECCPKFNPEKWDKKTFNWKRKLFIKESVPQLFHIPFPPTIGKKITKMMNLATKENKVPKKRDEILMLFNELSLFKSEILVSVTESVPGANNVSLSGTFMVRAYEGDFKDVPKCMKDMEKYLEKNGKKADKYYIHYAYCPKCTKKFGHNYVTIFAKIN